MKKRTADQALRELEASQTYVRLENLYVCRDTSQRAEVRSVRIRLILELVGKLRQEIDAMKEHLLPGEWEELSRFLKRSKKYPLIMWCLAEEGFIIVPSQQSP